MSPAYLTLQNSQTTAGIHFIGPMDDDLSFVRQFNCQASTATSLKFALIPSDLHQIFARQVPEGDMEPLAFSQFCGSDTVEFLTRYFTSRHDDPISNSIPFNQHTDPHGVLSRMSNSRYFHGEDNQVLYYALEHSGDKRKTMWEPYQQPLLFIIVQCSDILCPGFRR